jgi:FKBP-type peptidyl-prolyl cis-trans isomerase 2
MRYIGRLVSGKQFDANTSGKPFSFKLGRGEVIKGWDEGIKVSSRVCSRRAVQPLIRLSSRRACRSAASAA